MSWLPGFFTRTRARNTKARSANKTRVGSAKQRALAMKANANLKKNGEFDRAYMNALQAANITNISKYRSDLNKVTDNIKHIVDEIKKELLPEEEKEVEKEQNKIMDKLSRMKSKNGNLLVDAFINGLETGRLDLPDGKDKNNLIFVGELLIKVLPYLSRNTEEINDIIGRIKRITGQSGGADPERQKVWNSNIPLRRTGYALGIVITILITIFTGGVAAIVGAILGGIGFILASEGFLLGRRLERMDKYDKAPQVSQKNPMYNKGDPPQPPMQNPFANAALKARRRANEQRQRPPT
jgi:hypothetical protein